MNEKSTIEFEEISEGRQLESVRKSFRVAVQNDIIKATIEGKTYPVTDISPGGISILCEKKQGFAVDQIFSGCELFIPGDTIKSLSARVVHMTLASPENFQVGIQWQNLSDDDLTKIALTVSELKKALLSESGQDKQP